jgi:hypothetical protein
MGSYHREFLRVLAIQCCVLLLLMRRLPVQHDVKRFFDKLLNLLHLILLSLRIVNLNKDTNKLPDQ